MKKLASLLSLSLLLLSAKAIPSEQPLLEKSRINLAYCSNFNQTGVDPFFISCVNNNFSTIARLTGGFYSYCINNGPQVDYFYIYCVNANFRDVQRQLQNRVYLQDCQNYDRTKLEYFYVYCVNNNFNQIQRAVNGIIE